MRHSDIVCDRMVAYRPPRIAMSLLIAAATIEFLIPIGWPQLPSLPLAGLSVASLGFILMIRAWWLFRIHHAAICPTAATSILITSDVFALTRNPMYLGMVMMLLGVALFTGAWPFYLSALAYGLILDKIFCRYEERKMHGSFGKCYEKYVTKVRRWL
ncbi:MAG: isoprenylcysteine carboxylmethyltransferase family protein [Gammaproteobacteria bacterium]|nr:isoprenylcysteine carboxylmethyltransferase family protein [Gammaproteobacteria bacterium]